MKSSTLMPGRELVVVVRRKRHHCQDLAGLRIHDDRHALADVGRLHSPGQCLRREALDAPVDREHQVLPGDRLADRLDDVQQPAGRVALDELHAVVPAKLVLERCFHARPADHVVTQVARRLEPLELLAVDRPGVAHDVRHQRSGLIAAVVEIAARGLDLDDDPGQLLRLLRQQQSRIASDPALDRHEVERRSVERAQPLPEKRHIAAGDPRNARQDPLGGRIRQVGRAHVHRPRRRVHRHGPAGAVEDQSPRRGNWHLDGAVGRCTAGELVALHDLQLEEAPPERRDRARSRRHRTR